MNFGILAQALVFLVGTTAYAPKISLDEGLNTAENGIKSCFIEVRPDGDHLLLSIIGPNVGNALQFQSADHVDSYD